LDVERVAQSVTGVADFGNKSDVLTTRYRRHPSYSDIDLASYSKASARVIRMSRPRIMRRWCDQRDQTIHEVRVITVPCCPANEPCPERRFLYLIPDNVPTDKIGTVRDGPEIRLDPISSRDCIRISCKENGTSWR
jgi:hypothetical protein